MTYDLTTPCANCPFRNDITPFIHPERCEEILNEEGTFRCHKTDDHNVQHCAGFLIIREKEDRPNQMMRIAERLGAYDHTKLNMDAPIYDSVHEAVSAHEEHHYAEL